MPSTMSKAGEDMAIGMLRVLARGDMPSTGPECNSREDLEIALMLMAQATLAEIEAS